MKNKEKFAEELLPFSFIRESFAVNKNNLKIVKCDENISCLDCLFHINGETCRAEREKWANSEYVEKISISKKDRDFLFYLDPTWNYMKRDADGSLWVFDKKPATKGDFLWFVNTTNYIKITPMFLVDFPMVKWTDDDPWDIADFYGLEVVEKYDGKIN